MLTYAIHGKPLKYCGDNMRFLYRKQLNHET